MTTALTKYDAACRAIAEAATVDEVKGFHDEAKAMAAYARQAKNRELEAQCVEIRMRATRRLGEMIAEQKRTVGLNRGNAGGFSNNPPDERPTLESQGIGKNLAQQARTLSLLPEARFEERVAEARSSRPREHRSLPAKDHVPQLDCSESARVPYTEGLLVNLDWSGLAALCVPGGLALRTRRTHCIVRMRLHRAN